MDGLLLRLLNDDLGSPGRSFWPCFKPLRSVLDQHRWIFPMQPWMGAPTGFDHADGEADSSVALWRKKTISVWADKFSEEDVELWAVNPSCDAARLMSEFQGTPWRQHSAFIEKHAEIWLIYTDRTCWEIFARRTALLQSVRNHLVGNATIRVYVNATDNRAAAYRAAGVDQVWRNRHE